MISPVRILRSSLYGAAGELQMAAHELGAAHVTEADMRRAVVRSLQTQVGRLVQPEVPAGLSDWPKVGGVDIGVRAAAGDGYALMVELKWCRTDKLYECLWDVLKMAVASTREDVENSYVLAAAPDTLWATSAISGLFEAEHWPLDLLFDRFETEWGWLLKGAATRPKRLPSIIAIEPAGAVPIHCEDGEWTLRALRAAAATQDWTSFDGDWPAR